MGKVRTCVVDDSEDNPLLTYRQVSPVVDTFIEDKEYLGYIDEDDVTDTILLQEVIVIVVDELKDMGIEFTCELPELMDDSYRLGIVPILRDRFDSIKFYSLLSTLSNSIVDTLDSYITTSIEEDMYDEVLTNIITLLHTNLPISTVWAVLYNYREMVVSTHEFVAHIGALLTKYHKSPNDTIIDNHNIENLATICRSISEEHELYQHNIQLALKDDLSLDRVAIVRRANAYHNDIASHPDLPYLPDPSIPMEIMDQHRKRQPHHIEYYLEHKDELITSLTVTMIMAAIVSDSSITDKRGELERILNIGVPITMELQQKMLHLLRILHTSLPRTDI